ncbi:hypothetical protein KFK09_014520 [Dendrobium nobile]|uniref:Uncharacterized protein n=1 Tax=Dendrobium nobile TaxID=94219 RepID=A0A8T3B897_DENNO|nr:hypothetical protein KFK09_014520 [Dendrobium nobile]
MPSESKKEASAPANRRSRSLVQSPAMAAAHRSASLGFSIYRMCLRSGPPERLSKEKYELAHL